MQIESKYLLSNEYFSIFRECFVLLFPPFCLIDRVETRLS